MSEANPNEAAREHKQITINPTLARLAVTTALFAGSTLFVESLRLVSILEFGGLDTQPGSPVTACRWDCLWYQTIVTSGYHLEPRFHPNGDAANWAFFPLFPLIAKGIYALTGIPAGGALILSSKIFLFISIATFIGYCEPSLGKKNSRLAGAVLAFSPYAIYAHAGYTESLFFFLTTLAFWLLERGNWIGAGLAGGLLSATRVTGIGFCLSYASRALSSIKSEKPINRKLNILLGMALIPSGLALFMIYLHSHMGDALAFSHVNLAWGRTLSNPLATLFSFLQLEKADLFFALTAVAGLLSAVWLALKRRYDLAAFMATAVIIPLASGVLWAMPRYVFWQMPFVLAVTEVISLRREYQFLYLLFAASLGTIVTMAWFRGNFFVV